MSESPGHRRHTLPRAFLCALSGIGQLLKGERNVRIQVFIAAMVIALAIGLGVTRIEWCLLILCIAGVIVTEAINSAIERAVDHTSLETHPLAKQSKDIAAGAVLLAVIGACGIGAIIFIPRLLSRIID